ncbi:MAG: MotA/TolQ/ExbB proton channel family protein [Alphaproteobacteria bacterium]
MATDTNTGGAPIRPISPPAARNAVDIATIVGIPGAFALIFAAIYLGGTPGAFINLPSIFIVLGGTFGVTTACYSLADMVNSVRIVAQTVFHRSRDSSAAAVHVLQLAQIARYRGVLALQPHVDQTVSERMLHRGLTMVMDGTPGDEIERIMQQELQAIAQRHTRSASVLRKAADISPAMGLIGTLVGLIQMLGNLEDPSTIGPSMAVALLTTFYGAILANMVFMPLASKLERNSSEETLINHLYVMASASIGRQENPRRLEMLLNTILPPGNRVEYFN